MKLVISILGQEVFSVEIARQRTAQALAEAIAELVDDDDDKRKIAGGETHNFERDHDPLNPDDRWDWPWDDRHRGFGFR